MHYYMFYKPYGCVTARTDDRYPTVMDYFRELNNDKLSPVGRLDRETEGLLLITDDGKWNQEIIHPARHIEKTYEFLALGRLEEEKMEQLRNGIVLTGADTPTAPAKISVYQETCLGEVLCRLQPEVRTRLAGNLPEHPVVYGKIVITEGKKRQIRRMLKAVRCYVIFLKRISIGNILLDENLQAGEWKEIFPSPACINAFVCEETRR